MRSVMVAQTQVHHAGFSHLRGIVKDVLYGIRDVRLRRHALVETHQDDVRPGCCALPGPLHVGVRSGRDGGHVRAVRVDGGIGLRTQYVCGLCHLYAVAEALGRVAPLE